MTADSYGLKAHAEEYFARFNVPFKLALNDIELRAFMPTNGVVLIHAPWSGYSLQNMFRVLKLIQSLGKPYEELVIADIDGLSIETIRTLLGGPAHGFAEGILVRGGNIKAIHAKRDHFEAFMIAISTTMQS